MTPSPMDRGADLRDSVDCPNCFHECDPAALPGGGRVAWFCVNCQTLYPDGDYVNIEPRPLGMPR